MLDIVKEYSMNLEGANGEYFYVVNISVKDDNNLSKCGFKYEHLFNNSNLIDVNKLSNIDFYISNKIKFVIEKDEIIPIGLVNFIDDSFNKSNIRIKCDKNDLHIMMDFINNIHRAIELQYKVKKFHNKFIEGQKNIEKTPLE